MGAYFLFGANYKKISIPLIFLEIMHFSVECRYMKKYGAMKINQKQKSFTVRLKDF
jgi:hypothetical protein